MKPLFQQPKLPDKPAGMPELRMCFPVPVYATTRELIVENENEKEKKEIEDIIKEGMRGNAGTNSQTVNSHIFDTKLHNLKVFCEQHIKNYVKEIINPKEDFDFYITQSWINLNKPGQNHIIHWHPNSLISGIYYIATVEDDQVRFHDPNKKLKSFFCIELEDGGKSNPVSQPALAMGVNTRDLLLFPSWLEHDVPSNPKATTNRISLAFNTFAKGTFGQEERLNELILS